MEETMRTAMLLCILLVFVSGLPALTGYGTSSPVVNDTVDPALSITAPNEGDIWYIGDIKNITWTATDTNILPYGINIWYSLNGGVDYLSIIENTYNDGIYSWEVLPAQGYNARMRIMASDSFGNFTHAVKPFMITYVPPKPPEGVTVDTSSNQNAVISWLPVTENIYDSPLTPDGYIVLYNETPYEDDHFYYFLGRSYTTSYTHLDVAEFRDQMFYKVVAYKNYRGEVDHVLDTLLADPDTKISLPELKAALHKRVLGGEK